MIRRKRRPQHDGRGMYSDQPYLTDSDAAHLLGSAWDIVRIVRCNLNDWPRDFEKDLRDIQERLAKASRRLNK